MITYCFDKWWRPVLFCLIATLLFGITVVYKNAAFAKIGLAIFLVGQLVLFISAIYQFVKKMARRIF